MTPDEFALETAKKLGLEEGQFQTYKKADVWQLRNALWQGHARSHRSPVAFVFLNPEKDARTESETAVRNSLARLAPPPGGFDAVAMVERHSDGRWVVSKLIEDQGSTLGVRLKQYVPDLEIVSAAPISEEREAITVGPQTARLADEIAGHLRSTPNVVLQGPPGTGKSFLAQRTAERLAGESDAAPFQLSGLLRKMGGDLSQLIAQPYFVELPLVWDVVQMHPGYTYDDFVRGRTLVADDKGSRFESVDRTMVQFCAIASARGERPTLLVLEEMNRCSLAAVLGDLIFAIDPDHRGESVHLQMPPPPTGGLGIENLLAVPKGLKLLGTMNTADRSLALVDFAVRRRFRFVDVLPDPGVISEYYGDLEREARAALRLFNVVLELVGEERLRLGHSYFLCSPGDGWSRRLANRMAYEVLPMLREYVSEGRQLNAGTLQLGAIGQIPLEAEPLDLSDGSERDLLQRYLES